MKHQRQLNREHQNLIHHSLDFEKKLREAFELWQEIRKDVDKITIRHMNMERKNDKKLFI